MTDFAGLELVGDKQVTAELVNDSLLGKLQLEAELLYTGLKQGAVRRLDEMVENPLSTTLQIGGAAAIGLGLSYLRASGYGRAAHSVALGLGILAGLDLGFRLSESTGAMRSVWNDPSTFDRSRDLIANNLGGLLVDYPILVGSGYMGSKFVLHPVPTYTKNILSPQYRYVRSTPSKLDLFSLAPVLTEPMEK